MLSRSVFGFHCDLRDVRYAVLRVSGVMSVFNCRQSAELQKELVVDLLGGTPHH